MIVPFSYYVLFCAGMAHASNYFLYIIMIIRRRPAEYNGKFH